MPTSFSELRDSARTRRRAVAGTVRIGPLLGLPRLLREFGVDPGPVFAAVGFDLAEFDDPDLEVSYVAASKLLARCTAATGCDHLGLLLGSRIDPSALGVPGFLLAAAPDVGTALGDLVRNLDLHDSGAVLSLARDDRVAVLEYAIHLPGVAAANQIYDLSISVACRVMRSLCGASWDPTEVQLAHRAPPNPAPYQRFFRAPLRFDAERSGLVFPSRCLEHRTAAVSSLLHRHLEEQARELHCRRQAGFAGMLRPLLRKSLGTRRCTAAVLARRLGVHERTLHRRLVEEGTSFRHELEAARYILARRLLGDGEAPLTQIAAALDYADTAAFCRAFKRWSGTPPAAWRARRQEGRPEHETGRGLP